MCGIVGYVGDKQVVPLIIGGLRKLEYRGYDSAGIAVVDENHELKIRRAEGKLRNLEVALRENPLDGTYGVGHTRWATHGRPTEENAHPHRDCTGRVVVVHNGIIENYLQLKDDLRKKDHRFVTETDTEIVAHLIEEHLKSGADFEDAVRKTVAELRGIFALSMLSADAPDTIISARQGPPVVIGLGEGEYFVASDIPAILEHTRNIFFLGDGEIAVMTRDGVRVTDFAGQNVEPQKQHITWDPIEVEKGGFKHFMLKEIYEQPRAVRETVEGRISLDNGRVFLDEMKGLTEADFKRFTSIKIAACGTSWHAGLAGKYMIEQLARINVDVDYASEFRYRDPVLDENTLLLVISQSGETADTIAPTRLARERGCPVIAVTNTVGSAITREADAVLFLQAGPEIAVAASKTFVAQVTTLIVLAAGIGRIRGTLPEDEERELAGALRRLPEAAQRALDSAAGASELARRYVNSRGFMFVGRGYGYPAALEGALKLKEISYLHAEGYAAGELKHGPISLLDAECPLVAVATRSSVYEKLISNVMEGRARDAKVIAVATEGDEQIERFADDVCWVPDTHEALSPILAVIPLQLFAYHTAVARGTDVDQPRNLAKSVTVE